MQHSAFNSKFTRVDIIQLCVRFMTVAAELNAQVDEPAVKNNESHHENRELLSTKGYD